MDDEIEQELTDKQLAAARLLATDPTSTKQDVAATLNIGRRTIFRWMNNPAFVKKIEEFKRSALVKPDVGTILKLLSQSEKSQLLEKLLGQKGQSSLPQIKELEDQVMGLRDTEQIEDAIDKIERLAGRLRKRVIPGADKLYDHTGRAIHNATTLKARIRHLKSLQVICRSVGIKVEDSDEVWCPSCRHKINLLDVKEMLMENIERAGKGNVDWDDLTDDTADDESDDWDEEKD